MASDKSLCDQFNRASKRQIRIWNWVEYQRQGIIWRKLWMQARFITAMGFFLASLLRYSSCYSSYRFFLVLNKLEMKSTSSRCFNSLPRISAWLQSFRGIKFMLLGRIVKKRYFSAVLMFLFGVV